MRFHILTLFPEMVMQGLNTSIIGNAVEQNLIEINVINIRDFTKDRHKKVDDYPYGGGAGMVMQAQPIYDAWKSIVAQVGYEPRCVYLTPQGQVFAQGMAKEYAREEDLIFLCGHYEGVDERVLEEIVTDYVSIGDYVLTGGELPAMVMVDAISRMVPARMRTVFPMGCWNIRSIAVRRTGTERKCRRYCFPEIIKRLKAGDMSSLCSGRCATGRNCWRKQNSRGQM